MTALLAAGAFALRQREGQAFLDVKVLKRIDNLSSLKEEDFRDLSEPGALPVRSTDGIQFRVKLSKPAYIYLIWFYSDGETVPVYPWKDGNWHDRLHEELKQEEIIPSGPLGYWSLNHINTKESGMVSVVLLVCEKRASA